MVSLCRWLMVCALAAVAVGLLAGCEARRFTRAALTEVLRDLRNDNAEVRRRALDRLWSHARREGSVDHEGAKAAVDELVPVLVTLVREGDEEERFWVSRSLHLLAISGVFDVYLSATGAAVVPMDVEVLAPYLYSNPPLLGALVYAGTLKEEHLGPVLRHLDEDLGEASLAARLLARQSPTVRAELVDRLFVRRKHAPTRALATALQEVELSDPEIARILDFLESRSTGNSTYRAELLRSLGGSAGAGGDWLARVERFLDDESPIVRGTAARVLGGAGGASRHLLPRFVSMLGAAGNSFSEESMQAELAAEAIERLGAPKEIALTLTGIVEDDHIVPRVRAAVMRCLPGMGKEAAPVSIRAVKHRLARTADTLERAVARRVLRDLQELVRATGDGGGPRSK